VERNSYLCVHGEFLLLVELAAQELVSGVTLCQPLQQYLTLL